MSTLVAQTISNGTVSTSSANVIQGSAKAWVMFTGSTGTVNSSYNVSSVTVNGTGQYTVNFTSALPNANYAFAGSSIRSGSTPILVVGPNGTITTTALPIRTQEYDASLGTAGRTSIIVLSS